MIKHLLRYTLLFVLTFCIVSFTWLTMSTSGLKTSLYVLTKLTPGNLNFSGVQGSFSKGIKIASLSYKNKETKFNIEQLNLKAQPLALFAGEFRLTKLNIKKLNIAVLPANTTTSSPINIHWQLPLHIVLHDVTIKQIMYQQNKQMTSIDNLLLSGEIYTNHLELAQLQFTYHQLIYAVQGDIGVNPVTAALHFSINNVDQQPQFVLALSAAGDWQQLNLKGEVTTPLHFSFNSQIDHILKDPQWTLKGIVASLNPHEFINEIDDAVYQGTIDAQGNTKQLNLNGMLTPQNNPESQTIKLQLSSADLENLLFDAQLQWQNLNWPLSGTARYSSSIGSITLNGNPKHYRYTADINLQGDNLPVSDWQFSGTGNPDHIQLSRFRLLMLGGKINGQGYFKWRTPLDYQLTLNATDLDPEHQWADWAGNLNFALNIRGNANNLVLQFSHLIGKLRQQNIEGLLGFSLQRNKLVDINAKINYGKAKLIINAEREPNLNVTWDVNIPDLAKLTPFGNGTLQTQGQISDLMTQPKIKGNINGTNLAWLNYQVGKLAAKFDIDANTVHKSSFTLESDNLKVNQLLFQTLTLNLQGNPQHFSLYGGALVNDNVITTSAQGNYADKQWHATFQQLDWKTPDNLRWKLASPLKFNIKEQELQIENFDWRANQQSLQLNMLWIFSKAPTGHFALSNFNLENLNQFLNHDITMKGRLDLQLTNQDDTQNTALDFKAESEQAELFYHDNPKDNVKKIMSIKKFTAKLHADTKALSSTVDMQLNDYDYLHLIFNLPNYDVRQPVASNQKISGELNAQFSKLDFLAFFLPNLYNVSGRLVTQLKWDGTLLAPHALGTLELRDGTANISQANLNLKNINFKLQADPENHIRYKLKMNSGKGSLIVDGVTDSWQEHYPTSLHIAGHNFLFMNNSNYKIIASPNITLSQRNQRFDLNGSIDVPEALISYRTANDVVMLPSDVVIETNASDENSVFLKNFYATLQLTLGTNVKISLDSLSAKLAGKVILKDSPKTPTLATGELTINDGTYNAFGQTLTINNGKLMYSGGAADNPGLLIKAAKSIRTYVNPLASALNSTSSTSVVNITPQEKIIVVGISVTNNLKEPVLTLFSDQPNLTKTDILSYLVLGYPLSQASTAQGQNLVQAANALNLGEGQSTAILSELQSTFKLDQVGLQSSNYLKASSTSNTPATVQQNTSLVLGKMLSPKLFVSYSIGLLAPINTVTASYALTNNLSTQTSSNILGSGIDVIYSFEHD